MANNKRNYRQDSNESRSSGGVGGERKRRQSMSQFNEDYEQRVGGMGDENSWLNRSTRQGGDDWNGSQERNQDRNYGRGGERGYGRDDERGFGSNMGSRYGGAQSWDQGESSEGGRFSRGQSSDYSRQSSGEQSRFGREEDENRYGEQRGFGRGEHNTYWSRGESENADLDFDDDENEDEDEVSTGSRGYSADWEDEDQISSGGDTSGYGGRSGFGDRGDSRREQRRRSV